MKRMLGMSLLIAMGSVACAIPAFGEINLSDCTKTCNTNSKACFDRANEEVDKCLAIPSDSGSGDLAKQNCLKEQTKAGEVCVNSLVSCVTECIDETEKQLGKK